MPTDTSVKKRDASVYFLLVLTAAIALANFLWLTANQRPPVDDEAMHLLSALKYSNLLQHPPYRWDLMLAVDFVYPPFFPFFAALTSKLLGISGIVPLVMSNIFFLAVTFLSLYGIGIKMGDRRLGVLASFILALCPMFFHLSRMFMLEIPLTAMVTLTLWLLLRSDGFKKTRWSVLTAVAVGCGLLTKQSFIIFFAGPALYSFLSARALADPQEKRRQILNVCLLATLGTAILFYWYADNWQHKLKLMTALASYQRTSPSSFSPFASLIFYLKALVQEQMSWVWGVACAVTILARIKKLLAPPLLFSLIWFAVPYVFLTLFANKLHYYTIPSLPAAALITSFGLLSIPGTTTRRIIITALLLLGFFQYFQLSFLSHQKRTTILRATRYTPVQKNYHVSTLLRRIAEESPVAQPTIGVMPIDADNFIRDAGIRIGENQTLANLVSLDYLLTLASKPYPLVRVDYIEHRGPPPRPTFYLLHDRIETMTLLEPVRDLYHLTDIFVMPDMSGVYLYKIKGTSPGEDIKVRMHQGDTDASLGNRLMRLALADGTWRIFYKGQPITKELSLYTMIQSAGAWVDSRLCRWKILSVGEDRVTARAFFSIFFPVQDWEFVLEDNRIDWTVRIFTPFFAKLDWEQASIMLSDTYRRWTTSRGSGDFPPAFHTEKSGSWPALVSLRSSDTAFIGLERADDVFPAVAFYPIPPRPGLTGQIINSNVIFRSRVLQYVAQHPQWSFLWPWKNEYFRGSIVIGDPNAAPDPES